MAWRVTEWAFTPEPFRIPTTSGQQPSVAGIRHSRVESPATRAGVVGRMLLEVLLFRSLFRNTAPGRSDPAAICPPPVFFERKALWIGALAFHWSLLFIVVRHVRLFVDPVPGIANAAAAIDGFFEIGLPVWYASDVVVSAALVYLLARRLRDPLLRYLSLPADYLALGVLLLVVGSGIGMRYIGRIDLVALRTYTLGLAAFPVGAGRWPVMPDTGVLVRRAPAVGVVPARRPAVHEDDARGRRVAEPDAQPGERHAPAPPREPVERAGAVPHLRGVGARVPGQAEGGGSAAG